MNFWIYALISLTTASSIERRLSSEGSPRGPTGPLKCPPITTKMWSCGITDVDACCLPTHGLLVLAQQWYPGLGSAKKFNLHGLWPDFCDGTYPEKGCDEARKYTNIKSYLDNDLVEQMNEIWPSYKGDNSKFWEYEWGKHGTCISTIEPRCFPQALYKSGDELVHYFKRTIELHTEFDSYSALEASGIIPKGKGKNAIAYKLEDMMLALKQKLSVRPKMTCKGDVLDELMFKFHLQGRDKYVPLDYSKEHDCPSTVKYPSKYD